MAKVSIIIPVYNAEKYVKQCIDSALGQTLLDIEVICVDDGSTDDSLDILKKYAAADSRFRYLTQANQYAGVARNNGMREASGEYLLFIDSDDYVEKELCAKTYAAAKACNADIVLFAADRFDERERQRSRAAWYLKEEMLPEADPFSRADLDGDILNLTFLGPWNKLFRREFVEEWNLTFQPLHNSNDDYFVAMALALAEKITAVHEPLTIHRFGIEGNLQSGKHKHPLCFLEAYEAVYDKLHELGIYEEVEKGFVTRVLTDCAYHFKTMKGTNAKREIAGTLSEEHFTRMQLLEYPELSAGTLRNKRYIEGMIAAYRMESECVLSEAEQAVFPNEYDYYAACWHAMEQSFLHDDYMGNDRRLRQTIQEKKELQEKLERTYREKSEINAKLQQTYREKAERGTELKELHSHFLVKVDMKLRKMFGHA